MKTTRYDFPSGRMLGKKYRVIGFLGQGWEGEVYKVEELTTGIIRAAKLFYPHRYTKHSVPPVEYAKKLHALQHCPIVIKYHHLDTLVFKKKTVDFLIADFIDGEMLSEYLARQNEQRLLVFEALHLFYAITKGVEQIHLQGEYHGDIHLNNILMKKHGLSFEVNFIDVLHFGRSTKARLQQDMIDLIAVLYDLLGGKSYYASLPQQIKRIILGRKHTLIRQQFSNGSQLRVYLENIPWPAS